MSSPRAHLVVDLGFGDAGKGHIVDFLVRTTGARWVVRTNGGAQAGHTVVLDDGTEHTFAQIGAGSFVAGVRTFLAEPVIVHPTALLVEAEVLAGKGVANALERLSADARCRVITPYHQAANRLRERARGAARHGSCGVGVGETVADSLAYPDETIALGTLRDPSVARRRLARTRERKREELHRAAAMNAADQDARLFEDPGMAERWLERACTLAAAIHLVDPEETLPAVVGDVVFEGAQGVLLDEVRGFHPFTTWSTCTFANPDAVLDAMGWTHERRRIGVLRSYHVRHGPGPFPTESAELDVLAEPHNPEGAWQGAFRRGFFDLVLARYAIAAVGGLDVLALTHLDALDHDLPWRIATRYDRAFAAPLQPSLEQSARMCASLMGAVPEFETLAGRTGHDRTRAFRAAIAELGPIGLESRGRRTRDLRAL